MLKILTIIYFSTSPILIIQNKHCINSRAEIFTFDCFEVNELNSFKIYTVYYVKYKLLLMSSIVTLYHKYPSKFLSLFICNFPFQQ